MVSLDRDTITNSSNFLISVYRVRLEFGLRSSARIRLEEVGPSSAEVERHPPRRIRATIRAELGPERRCCLGCCGTTLILYDIRRRGRMTNISTLLLPLPP